MKTFLSRTRLPSAANAANIPVRLARVALLALAFCGAVSAPAATYTNSTLAPWTNSAAWAGSSGLDTNDPTAIISMRPALANPTLTNDYAIVLLNQLLLESNRLTILSGPGTLLFTNNGTTMPRISIPSSSASAKLTIRQPLNVTTTLTVYTYNPSAMTFASNLWGAGSLVISNMGSGLVTLGGSNAFSGGVTLAAGKLDVRTGWSLGTGPLVINGTNAALDSGGSALTLVTTNQQFWNSSFSFGSPVNSMSLTMGPGTVTLGTDVILTVTINTFTVPGAITGAYGLVKAGPGVFALGGSNTYSGATIISNGILKLNAGASLNGTPLIQLAGAATTADVRSVTFAVQSNQVLQGNGLVQGSVSLNPGAILTPGNSIGTLTVSSNLNLTSGVSLHFELGATNASDQVLVGKNLALGGIQFADFLFSTNAGFGEGAYNLFDALTLSGSLGSVTNGSIAGMSAYLWTDTGNNNLMLSVIAIPEPTTLLALGVGLGLLASFRRRTG